MKKYTKHDTIARSRFYAMRDITIGEELSYDYGVNAMDQMEQTLGSFGCGCGENNCRVKIKCGFFDQSIENQRKYFRYLPKSLRRKYRERFRNLDEGNKPN